MHFETPVIHSKVPCPPEFNTLPFQCSQAGGNCSLCIHACMSLK